MDTSTQATELIPVKGPTGTTVKRQYRTIEEKRRIVGGRSARDEKVPAPKCADWVLHDISRRVKLIEKSVVS